MPSTNDMIEQVGSTGIPKVLSPEILQAVDRSIRTINTTGAAKSILRLPHRWQRVVHNAGDYFEGE